MAIFGYLDMALDSKKILQFFRSYTKSFLDFGRETSHLLNFSALEGLVSYKLVSYLKFVVII